MSNSTARMVLNIPSSATYQLPYNADELNWLHNQKLVSYYNPSLLYWCCAGIPVQQMCHPVGSAVGQSMSGLVKYLEGTSKFRSFGFKHSAIGPSFSGGPKFGTIFQCRDRTIHCFSKIETENSICYHVVIWALMWIQYLMKGLISFLYYYYYFF